MGNTLNQPKPPQGAQLTRKEGSLKPKNIDKLDPDKYASGLKKDNAMIGAGHADMKTPRSST
jgi:hypothetical protein